MPNIHRPDMDEQGERGGFRWRGESVGVFVVPAADVSPETLVAWCRERLTGFKCPRSIDFRDALPRREDGKLLKRLLRDEYWAGTGRSL